MEKELAKLTIADKKQIKPATQFTSKTDGQAAAYLLTVPPGLKVYRYDLDIVKHHPEKPLSKPLTKKGEDDAEVSLRKIVCMEIVQTAMDRTNNLGIGADGKCYVYDGCKQLYMKAPIKLDAGKKIMEFQAAELSKYCQNQLRHWSVRIEINPSQQHEIDVSDTKSMLDTREGPGDRSVSQFLELLTSHSAVSKKTHVALGMGHLFRFSGEAMKDCKAFELRSGITKGVQLFDKNGKNYVGLWVDAKRTAFYKTDYLHKLIYDCNIRDNRFATQLFHGVRASLKYAQNRSIVINKIEPEIAKNVKVGEQTMRDYFHDKYEVDIQPNLYVVSTDKADVYYPMDMLIICPHQRVPNEKLDDRIRRTVIMETAVLPDQRFANIRNEMAAAKLDSSNCVMQFFGIKMTERTTSIPLQVRPPPQIKVMKAGKPAFEAVDKAGWRMSALCAPTAALTAGFHVLHPRDFNPQPFVANSLIPHAGRRGIKLGQPVYEEMDMSNYNSMKPKFDSLKEKKTKFALIFDYARSKSHDSIKLLERESGVLTEQLKIETLQKAGGNTMDNIIAKINKKAMGENVVPVIEKCGEELSLEKKVLVIGIDISLPSRASPKQLFELKQKDLASVSSYDPAIVGFTANSGRMPHTILGDYYFQHATNEVLDGELLKKKFAENLDKFVKNRGAFPEHIIVMRDGVGSGQLHMTTQAEYPVFEQVCREKKGQSNFPNIIYIIVTKKHNKRFAAGTVGKEINPVPGSVVDRDVTRPDIVEFYLQSHKPIKGTAKPAHYSVMMNPKNTSMDAIQAFCNTQCFNHQIVQSAVSLPEPIYHAAEQAKRGRNNLAKYKENHGKDFPRLPNGLADVEKLAEVLSYGSIQLGNIKFAA